MGKIVGESFDPYVEEQILLRQKKLGQITSQDNDYHIWTVNKQPWMRVCSSALILQSKINELGLPQKYLGNELAKNYVLYGGVAKTNVIEGIESLSLRSGISNTLDNPRDLNNSYSYGFNSSNEFGYDPMPSVESITITPKNRGSLTEAQIRLHCYNVEQFNIIETLYLRLKYSILIEWGNTVYYDNTSKELITTPTDTVYKKFLNGEVTKNTLLQEISKERKNSSGNYDGFYGWVTNFNWALTNEGEYDINITAITMGDVIESISANEGSALPANPKFNSGLVKKSSQSKERIAPESALSNILYAFKNSCLEQEFSNLSNKEYFKVSQSNRSDKFYISIDGVDMKSTLINTKLELNVQDVSDASNPNYFTDAEFIQINAREAMIKFDPYVDIVKEKIFEANTTIAAADAVDANNFAVQDNTNTQIFVPDIIEEDGTVIVEGGVIDQQSNFLAANQEAQEQLEKKALSIYDEIENILEKSILGKDFSDPFPSYIKLGAFLRIIQDLIYLRDQNGYAINKINTDYTTNYCFNPENLLISLDTSVCLIPNSLFDITVGDSGWFLFSGGDFLTESDTDNKSYTMHIYVNCNYIHDVLEKNKNTATGETNILDCITSILTGINNACGNLIDLNLFYEEIENTYYVIDENLPFQGKGVTQFNVNGLKKDLGSFVKNIDVKCEISPALAKTMAIGAQASGNSNAESLPFANWNAGILDRIIREKRSISKPSSLLTPSEQFTLFQSQLYSTYFSDQTIDMLPTYKVIIDDYIRNKKGTFIPLNLSLEIDGLSGIKIFQAYSISEKYLPKNYRNNIIFITKGLSHTINRQEWITTIDGLSIPKPKATSVMYNLSSKKTSKSNNSSPGSSANPSEAYLNPPPLSTSPLPRIEPSQLSFSSEILKEIKTSEGFREYAYDDKNPDVKNPPSVIGKITIGYGSTKYFTPVTITRGGQQIQVSKGSEIKIGDTITESEAEKLLIESLQGFIDPIKNVGVALTQNEFDALLSLVYNAGGGILNTLGISSYLKSGDYMAAAGQFWKVRKSGGDILKGLEKRRGREETLYLTDNPDYDPATYKRNKST